MSEFNNFGSRIFIASEVPRPDLDRDPEPHSDPHQNESLIRIYIKVLWSDPQHCLCAQVPDRYGTYSIKGMALPCRGVGFETSSESGQQRQMQKGDGVHSPGDGVHSPARFGRELLYN